MGGTLTDWLRGEQTWCSPVSTRPEVNDRHPAPVLRENIPRGASSLSVLSMSEVIRILSAIEQGDPSAAEQLLPLVYDELRQLAAQRLAHETPGQTLQATALVHDAYLRLVDVDAARHWNSRGHFFAAAAEAMRRILVEQARHKRSAKGGGQLQRVELHRSSVENGVSEMRKVDQVAIPANKRVALEPGGLHLMMMGLKEPFKQGEKVPLTLVFEKAGKIDVELAIVPLGASPEKHEEHK